MELHHSAEDINGQFILARLLRVGSPELPEEGSKKAAALAERRLQLFQKLDQRLLIRRSESPKPPDDLACLTATGL